MTMESFPKPVAVERMNFEDFCDAILSAVFEVARAHDQKIQDSGSTPAEMVANNTAWNNPEKIEKLGRELFTATNGVPKEVTKEKIEQGFANLK